MNERTHSPIWPRTDEHWHLFYSLACCNVYPKHALAKQKQDKRPVFRLFLLSSSLVSRLVSRLFNFVSSYIFCTCLYFCSIKKVPLGFLLIFVHLLFSSLFPVQFPLLSMRDFCFYLIVTPWVTFGIAQCAHMLCVCFAEVCVVKLWKKSIALWQCNNFLGSTPFFRAFFLHFPRKLRKALNRNQLDRHDGIIRFARSSFHAIVYLTVGEQLRYRLYIYEERI